MPALPAAARDLDVSTGSIQLALTLYILALAAGQLLWGPLSDRFGRRPVLMLGLLFYAAGSAGAGLAPHLLPLLAARVAQGLGGSAGLVLGRTIIRDVSPPREAAARLALLNTFMSISPALAPMLGSWITVFAGWRWIFAILATMGALTLVAALVVLPETNRREGPPVAMLGSYLRLARTRPYRMLLLLGACSTTTFYGFLSAAPFIFVDRLHRPEAEIGFYFLAPMLGFVLGSFLVSRLIGRVELPRLIAAGLALSVTGTLLFAAAVFTGHLSILTVLGPIFLFTLGGGLVSPLALTSALGQLPGAVGAASGLYGCFQMAFGALCTLIVAVWHTRPEVTVAVLLLGSGVVSVAAFLRR